MVGRVTRHRLIAHFAKPYISIAESLQNRQDVVPVLQRFCSRITVVVCDLWRRADEIMEWSNGDKSRLRSAHDKYNIGLPCARLVVDAYNSHRKFMTTFIRHSSRNIYTTGYLWLQGRDRVGLAGTHKMPDTKKRHQTPGVEIVRP